MSITLVLALPDFSKPFILEIDSSPKAMGVVLMQQERPIAYHSQAVGIRNQGRKDNIVVDALSRRQQPEEACQGLGEVSINAVNLIKSTWPFEVTNSYTGDPKARELLMELAVKAPQMPEYSYKNGIIRSLHALGEGVLGLWGFLFLNQFNCVSLEIGRTFCYELAGLRWIEVQQYYQETNKTIIPSHDVPLMLCAQGYRNQYQDLPSNIIETCPCQNQMNIDSTTAIVPYEISQELDQHFNSSYAELDVIMELSSAPPNLSLPDNDYSEYYSASSDSQSIAPFPTGNQLEINETISRETAMEIEQQPIEKPPSPVILPSNAEGGERCSEIGRKLTAQLTSLQEKPSEIIIKG
ncbi:hypothetical protein ACH5RR_029801 [Cinchona calisaya]|uniref:Reverse transcriptase/retrotransposon-derived protein RNase H-like domain-containing protein n=1 Tax=Cinchona calisaya TaxID=153742 RepID=A0ABD2YWJ2_9GENT